MRVNYTPLPIFEGELAYCKIPDTIEEFTDTIWNSLNVYNKFLCIYDDQLETLGKEKLLFKGTREMGIT